MSTAQDGLGRDRTPRRTTRRSTATPIRDVSPPARSARAGSTALQNTPATRRSARATSRRSDQPRDVVNNNVLPEVQTQQSYAYGSSKTPVLPEQLHVRDTLTMRQVAQQMDSAINRAEQKLDDRTTNLEHRVEQSQPQNGPQRVTRRTSKEPSPPASVTTDLQKKQRVAAWADSLENSQLEDIAEEEASQLGSPDTRRTEPSSFPSGVFDQSYQYERGLRPPRKPPSSLKPSLGSRIGIGLGTVVDYVITGFYQMQQAVANVTNTMARWFVRVFNSVATIVTELPDSKAFSVMVRTFLMVVLTASMSYALCFGYSRFLCNPLSSSALSQTIESFCGACQSTRSHTNFTTDTPHADLRELTSALKHINIQIRSVESRLNSRLDSQVSALHTDIDDLRKEQSSLTQQLEQVSKHTQSSGSPDIGTPPLIPKINYFSPANGAIVIPPLTSPTRQAPISFPLRFLTRLLGIQKYRAHNPVMALEPWHDVGDCWCAAATTSEADSVRLGVGVREYIYPTELIIEHIPKETSLTPETAPRRIELWADLSHLDPQTWRDLGVNDKSGSPLGKDFGLLADAEYDLDVRGGQGHLQRFTLDVNQFGDLNVHARDFVVRVRSTWGGEFACLYRVRLHGVPVEGRSGGLAGGGEGDSGVDGGVNDDS